MKYDIFISYRRDGGRDVARILQQSLLRFYNVFFDFDSLQDGVFNHQILDAIKEAPIFILILSKGSMQRCINSDDWVRKEVEHAIKLNKKIIPVNIDNLFDGFPKQLCYNKDDIGSVIGGIQYSKLYMDDVYEDSLRRLIEKRIKPTIGFKATNSNNNQLYLKILTDADCILYVDGNKNKPINIECKKVLKLPYKMGTYSCQFVSKHFNNVFIDKIITIDESNAESLVNIKLMPDINKQNLYPKKISGKWGFVNVQGKEVIPLKYNIAGEFHEGLAYVEIDNSHYYINKTGGVEIELKGFRGYEFSEGVAAVYSSVNKYCNGFYEYRFIDKTGNFISSEKYDWAKSFSNGLAAVKKEGKWGYINKFGEVVLPFSFSDANSFSGGLAAVNIEGVYDGGKWGFINQAGRVAIDFKFDFVNNFNEDIACFGERLHNDMWKPGNGCIYKYGFINKSGEVVISAKYSNVSCFSEGLAAVHIDGEKWSFINKREEVVIKGDYDVLEYGSTYMFSEGFAAIQKNGKWGFINQDGEEVIKCKYEDVDNFHNEIAHIYDKCNVRPMNKRGKVY